MGQECNFFANLEVIVSAGTINTPQLLMLSGVRSKEHLISKSIPCVVNLPSVGKKLQDHIAVQFMETNLVNQIQYKNFSRIYMI